MKEYKIIRQKGNLLKNTDAEFEDDLNKLAREGWRVINSVCLSHSKILKVILERIKIDKMTTDQHKPKINGNTRTEYFGEVYLVPRRKTLHKLLRRVKLRKTPS